MNGSTLTWKRTPAGAVVPVGPGLYFAPVDGSSLETRAAALSRLLPPDVVIARRTAAWIWGLDVLPPGADAADWEIDLVTAAGENAPDPPSAECAALPSGHIVEEGGVRLTSRHRTALDCARWLPRTEAVASLDQFLRDGIALEDLRRMARALPGYRGSTRLNEIMRLSDPGAASPGETWVRVAIIRAGFPRPATQVPVEGLYGGDFYLDLGYPEHRVGLEYDGERHHTGPRARARDGARRRWITRELGWDLISVTKDFRTTPAPYLEALLTALLHRGWTPDPPTLDRITANLTLLTRRPHGRGGRRGVWGR
ncbi:hypothetical protein [Spirillospora albida]|uniref:hypothetical protein n=1 Tax=Spirillospora albida TaxID=58123 RepID=UPI00068D91E7|nr:hypothetical protein [Spirillospora albida]